jgi:hypothetical protein
MAEDHILNCYDQFKENDCVSVKFGDTITGPHTGDTGEVVRVLSPHHVTIRVGGEQYMVAGHSIMPCVIVAEGKQPAGRFPLARAAERYRALTEEGVVKDKDAEPEPFELEIKAMLVEKTSKIVTKLLELKRSWEQTHEKKLGKELNDFIEYFLPHIDTLISVIGSAESEADLNHARKQFEDLLELTASVKGIAATRGWVDLQIDQLKVIFE